MGLKLDKTFEQVIAYSVEQQEAIAKAMATQADGRPWMNFDSDTLEQKATEKKETELHSVFSRDKINEAYVQARQDPAAKYREIALAKVPGDFLGSCERDKRMQWRSRIRMFAHAAARSAGHGMKSGPLRKSTVDYIQRIIMKSTETEKTP